MKKEISEAVKNSNNLNDVRDSLLELFGKYRRSGETRIGYVSGMVTSEGVDNISKNIKILNRFTTKVRQEFNFPVFASTEVFNKKLFERIKFSRYTSNDWQKFWREVLGAKERFVTDMFMTPRWESSKGATDEHNVAKKMRMLIHYIKEGV